MFSNKSSGISNFLKKFKISQKILFVIIVNFTVLVIISNYSLKKIYIDSIVDSMQANISSRAETLKNALFSSYNYFNLLTKSISADTEITEFLENNSGNDKLKVDSTLEKLIKIYDIEFLYINGNDDELKYQEYFSEAKNPKKLDSLSVKVASIVRQNYSEGLVLGKSDFALWDGEIYYLSSYPIFSSESKYLGTATVGKKYDSESINKIASSSEVEFSFLPINEARMTNDQLLNYYEKGIVFDTDPKKERNIVYTSTNDFFNGLNLVLVTQKVDTSYNENLILFSAVSAFVSVIFVFVVSVLYIVIKSIVIKPFHNLTAEIEGVGFDGKINIDTSNFSSLEFIYLGEKIYSMLDKINNNTLAIKSVNDSLNIYSQAVNSATDEIFIFNNQKILEYINPAGKKALGYSDEYFIEEDITALISSNQQSFFENIIDYVATGNYWKGELTFKSVDKVNTISDVLISPVITSSDIIQRFIMVKRADEEKQFELKLQHISHHDNLTGLPNRVFFFEHLHKTINESSLRNKSIDVFWIDIDKFKYVNETLGHNSADALLTMIGKRFISNLTDNFFISRVGGDEFAVIISDGFDNSQKLAFASKIHGLISKPFTVNGKKILVSASIGSSTYPEDSDDAETLVKNADEAMYNAKFLGRNQYCMFSKEIHENIRKRATLETELSLAVSEGCSEFVPYFQAKVDSATNKIIATEALIRWNSKNGLIFPDQFIPIIEETGLIVPISRWIILQSCMYNQQLINRGYETSVSVNVSTKVLLDPFFMDMIDDALLQSGMEAKYLDVEITEGTLMDDVIKVNDVFAKLNKKDISVTLDDFGTGYSSLSYLKKFNVTRLKIDRSFVTGIPESSDDIALVEAILAMAKSLQILVTAEGVETKDQFDFLTKVKCDEIQGYFVSKPITFEVFSEFIDKYNKG